MGELMPSGRVSTQRKRRNFRYQSGTHVEPSVSRRDGGSGFWALRGGYKFTEYNLDTPSSELGLYGEQQTDRGVGFFSADAGLFFERDLVIGSDRLVQTLNPESII